MNFIVGFPKSRGHTATFVVMDRLTKSKHFSPLKPGFTAKIVAAVFMEPIIKLDGFPQGIVSDRVSIFLSSFWR